MNPIKLQHLREEIQYLLDSDFIEPSQSDRSSLCILVPKQDGTFRMCIDYRIVTSVTKTDIYQCLEWTTALTTSVKQNK